MNAEKTGNLIKQLRINKKLTQVQLAQALNISDKAVSKWERGDGCPDITIMPKLSEVLCVEIETLLEGEIPKTQNLEGMCIKDYNFYQPDRYPQSMQKEILSMGERIKQNINKVFTVLLNERCEFSVFAVDQMTNIEFLRTLSKPCFFYDFNYAKNGFCIEVDFELGKTLLKQDFNVYHDITEYDLDVFKNYFLKKTVSFLEDEICKNTSEKIDREMFSLENIYSYSSANNTVQEENLMMLLLTMHCNFKKIEGFMNIQLSEGLLKEMSKNDFFTKGYSNQVKFQFLSNIKTKQNPENIFVEFGRFYAENIMLENGKILILDKKETDGLNVVFQNKVIHTGKAIVADETMGVEILESHQLNEIIYDEEDYISVVLGFAYLTSEEINVLHKGSYLLLKQKAGDPCLIYRGKKLIATGEICITYQKFAVKIIGIK